MLWRVEFVQTVEDSFDYLATVHELEDKENDRKIISLSVSPDEYEAGTFEREPRRLEFEAFADEWIRNKIFEGDVLTGGDEYERQISHYMVRVYKDNVLFFTGIIDTSALGVDEATEIVRITAYAPDRLFALFDDLEAQYSLSAGYTVQQLFALHINQIRERVGVPINYNTAWFERPSLVVNINNPLVVAEFDITGLGYLPPNGFGYTYSFVDAWGPRWGWFVEPITQVPTFLMVQIVTIKAAGAAGNQYYLRVRARLARVFNNVCPEIEEYDENPGWVAEDDFAERKNLALGELDKWLRQWGVTYAGVAGSPGLPHQWEMGDRGYGYDFEPGVRVMATFYGRLVPAKLHPGKAVVEATSEKTNCLELLQAMMWLNCATITSDAQGTLYLRAVPQGAAGEPTVILDKDILEMRVARSEYGTDTEATLDVLAGDTELLAEQVQAWHDGLQRGRWEAEASLAGDYALELGQKVRLRGANWMVTSVGEDLAQGVKRIRAWKLLP